MTRMSQLFGETRRETPAGTSAVHAQLLQRAAYLRLIDPEHAVYLPLAASFFQSLETLLQKDLASFGVQPIQFQPGLSVNQSAAIKSNPPFEDLSFQQIHDDQMNMVNAIISSEIHSFKDLPRQLAWHQWSKTPLYTYEAGLFSQRFKDDLVVMILERDASLVNAANLRLVDYFLTLFANVNLPVKLVEGPSQQLIYLCSNGHEQGLSCPKCGYAANQHWAKSGMELLNPEKPLALKKVFTPGCSRIESLSNFLSIPIKKTAKALFYQAWFDGRQDPLLVFAIVRGDHQLSISKFSAAIQLAQGAVVQALRMAENSEVTAIGAVPGFASPLGINRSQVLLIVDELIPISSNLVSGANQVDYHLLNVNYERDYLADVVADIRECQVGDACPVCGESMDSWCGEELVEVSNLLTAPGKAASFTDGTGEETPVFQGRLCFHYDHFLASVVEENHDAKGIVWPSYFAPYKVHLVLVPSKDNDVATQADQLYELFLKSGISCLYDDRNVRAGVKFNDADLIGLPIRATISERTLSHGCIELKIRNDTDPKLVNFPDIVQELEIQLARV